MNEKNFHASVVVNKEMAQNHILSAIDVEQKMKLFENVEATAPQHHSTTALRNTDWLCEEYSLRISLKLHQENFSLKTPKIKFTMRVAKMQIYFETNISRITGARNKSLITLSLFVITMPEPVCR